MSLGRNNLKQPLLADGANFDPSQFAIEIDTRTNDESPASLHSSRKESTTSRLPSFSHADIENQLDDLVAPTPALQYMHRFDATEKAALEKQYNKTIYQLDDMVDDYKNTFWAYRIQNYCFIGVDVLYTPFQIVTGRDGIQSFLRLFNKNIQVPSEAGFWGGTLLAIPDLLFNLNAISAPKEAIKSTLEAATSASYAEQLREYRTQAADNPKQALLDMTKYVFNKAVLYAHNLVGSASDIIAFYEPIPITLPFFGDRIFPDWMNMIPKGAQWGIAGTVCYFGNGYYSKFSNPDYLEGFNDFWMKGIEDLASGNENGQPWLLGEIRRGSWAVPLQVAIQGLLSTVAIRAYPNFFYLGDSIAKSLLDLSEGDAKIVALSIAGLVAWHTLCARYPKTYNRYLGDQVKVEALLRISLENVVHETVDNEIMKLGPSADPNIIAKRRKELTASVMQELVAAQKRHLSNDIAEEKGTGYVFKEDPVTALQLAYRMGVGAYLGYGVLSPALTEYIVNEPISMTTLSILAGAGVLGGALYAAEKTRVTNHLIRQHLDKDMKIEEDLSATSTRSKIADRVADGLTVGSNAGRALSTMGSGARVMGDNPAGISTTAIIAVEQMINTILFTAKKVRGTVRNWSCFKQDEPTTIARPYLVPGTLFNSSTSINDSSAPYARLPDSNDHSEQKSALQTFLRRGK